MSGRAPPKICALRDSITDRVGGGGEGDASREDVALRFPSDSRAERFRTEVLSLKIDALAKRIGERP